jgi:hypothetical protein
MVLKRDGGSTASEPHQKLHLYLVCDDWDSGYNIHKLSLPADSGDDDEQRGYPKLF